MVSFLTASKGVGVMVLDWDQDVGIVEARVHIFRGRFFPYSEIGRYFPTFLWWRTVHIIGVRDAVG